MERRQPHRAGRPARRLRRRPTGREDGQQTVAEFRWRADPGDAWGAPTTIIVTAPPIAIYEEPGDGWVEVACYSIRDTSTGKVTSLYSHLGVVRVFGGAPVEPRVLGYYVDQSGNNYVDQNGNKYEG